MSHSKSSTKGRTSLTLATALTSAILAGNAWAQDVVGELVILQWQGGVDAEMWERLEDGFEDAHPGVTVREQLSASQGDARSGMRTILLGGENIDIIINAWPAFRTELAEVGLLRPADNVWDDLGVAEVLSQSWRDMSTTDGTTYGVTYVYGNRSSIWYSPKQLADASVEVPVTWDDFVTSVGTLREAGYAAPIPMPAKSWAHGEWFESLLLRTGGVEAARKLAAHEIAWTDDVVKDTLRRLAALVNDGCCGSPEQMFAWHWGDAAAEIFGNGTSNYVLIGSWLSSRLAGDFGLEEGKDFATFQFPALGLGHDNTASVDTKEVLVSANSANPAAAEAFLAYMSSEPATRILAEYGYVSPSSAADRSLLGPVQQASIQALEGAEVHFVLGDLLPGDLVDEYRVQLQTFLANPTEETIEQVTAAIEAKANEVY